MSESKVGFYELFLGATRNGVYKSSDSHGERGRIVNMGELFAYDFVLNRNMKRIAMIEEELTKDGLQKADIAEIEGKGWSLTPGAYVGVAPIEDDGAVNQMLTSRNWAIGYYIVEFEQNGQDRADYGSSLLTNLADKLNIKGLDRQMLTLCRIFYKKYPQMCGTVYRKLKAASSSSNMISAIHTFLPEPENIRQDIASTEICGTASRKFEMDPELLITGLSFSHIKEIMALDDLLERFFYELEYLKGVKLPEEVAPGGCIENGL